MKRLFLSSGVLLLYLASFTACVSSQSQQGVQNRWRNDSLKQIQIGNTTQSDVAKLLGPPSQIIGLKNQVIYYYLLEDTKRKGVFFIVYNWSDAKTIYDRAIFFFNSDGILTDYAYSLEKAEYEV